MRTDGQTDMAKLVVTFRNFADAPVKLMKVCQLVGKFQTGIRRTPTQGTVETAVLVQYKK